jgi:hypothetical protein
MIGTTFLAKRSASAFRLATVELADERPGAAVQVVAHGLALSVQAQAAFALLVGADPKVRDEPSPMCRHGVPCKDTIFFTKPYLIF